MSNTRDITGLLLEHGVRPTPNRILIARALAGAGRPLSIMELEDLLPSIDKSNIFRSVMAFKQGRMLHLIEDGGDSVRYELCHCHHDGEDSDMHAHFYCELCHKTYCLENIPIPETCLPRGFEMRSANFVIKGVCPECASKRLLDRD